MFVWLVSTSVTIASLAGNAFDRKLSGNEKLHACGTLWQPVRNHSTEYHPVAQERISKWGGAPIRRKAPEKIDIISIILSTMFYNRTINICHISELPWVTASVRRPKGGGAEPARPPLNPPLTRAGLKHGPMRPWSKRSTTHSAIGFGKQAERCWKFRK